MRKYLFILVAVFALIGCRKDSKSLNLIGKWELRSTLNGLTGARTDHPAGNGSFLKFSEVRYESYFNDQLIKSGSFRIVMDRSAITEEPTQRIIYDNETDAVKSFIRIDGNELTVWIDAYDGPSMVYERKYQ